MRLHAAATPSQTVRISSDSDNESTTSASAACTCESRGSGGRADTCGLYSDLIDSACSYAHQLRRGCVRQWRRKQSKLALENILRASHNCNPAGPKRPHMHSTMFQGVSMQ